MSERPNYHPLHLPTEFYLAIVDVMSKMRIGKSAAILWTINEGLRKHGYIDEETHGVFQRKYSRPLMEIVQGSRKKKAEVGKPKPRCQWAAGSAKKCRRIAQLMMQKGSEVIAACPEHISKFRDYGFEVVDAECQTTYVDFEK